MRASRLARNRPSPQTADDDSAADQGEDRDDDENPDETNYNVIRELSPHYRVVRDCRIFQTKTGAGQPRFF
jgi:hypothetical protein